MGDKKQPPDFWLFALTVALLAIGVFMVFNASYAVAGQVRDDSYYYLRRQALFAVLGLVLMFGAMRVRYWKLRRLSIVTLLLAIIALAAVFVPGVGITVGGSARWIGFGPLRVQPSELAKLALVLYLAAYLACRRAEIRDWKHGLLPVLVPIGLVGMLVIAEPDMGTAIVIGATGFVMLFLAGARKRHMAVLGTVAAFLIIALIMSSPYRRARVTAFVDPFADYHGSGYQVCRSLIALGSGGVFGVGLCEGREKVFYLPAEHTDFIFAVLGEEAGLLGTAFVAILFVLFALRGFAIASRTKENLGKFLAAGLTTLICGQALLNMLVVTSSVPATGVPLPFISYGGSSLVLNLLGAGILLGISQYPGKIESYENRPDRRRNRGSRLPRR